MASSTSRMNKSHKNASGRPSQKRIVVQPKMFATSRPRCPVKLLKTFLSHRPKEMKNNGPFYLAVTERLKSQVWYKRQRMGIHSMNSFMKSMAAQADIDDKRLTNHSARKTLVKKLKAANQPRSAIIGVTCHTNERPLADYEEGDDNEQRLISLINFLNFLKLSRSGKHVQSTPSSSKCWPFLCCGKHADDE